MSCQSEDKKVFLAVANGNQQLAQGLSRLVSPSLRVSEPHGFIERVEGLQQELNVLMQAVEGLPEKKGGYRRKKEVAIGFPKEKKSRQA